MKTIESTLSENELVQIMGMADANNDGKVNSDEWFEMVSLKPM